MAEQVLGLVPDDGEGSGEPLPVAARLLGAELRRMRNDLGLRLADVVTAGVAKSQSTLSRYEKGTWKVPEEMAVALARHYEVTDPHQLADIRKQARQAAKLEWWDSFRDVVDSSLDRLIGTEASATDILTYEGFFIPGLLQTPDYARAVFQSPIRTITGTKEIAAAQLRAERRWLLRQQRQQLLQQPDAPEYSAVIDQAVLAKPTGGRKVMRGQLRHLYNLAENKERIHIRVLPFAAAEQATALTSSMTLFKFPAGQGDELVYVEATNHGGTYITAPDEVVAHKTSLWELLGLAGGKQETLELLESSIDSLKDLPLDP
ncbi:helix-turn-helix domain-containing protein [Streptomyces sp. CA-294286]|uniref:helix-turn-helix domain-containing protein n=1 Tax=Streptomyces sp. CA-294286 TaxID=3240070 RepID=UPI003D90FD44